MTNAPSPLPLAQRGWLTLTQAALFLPFVTARGCDNGEATDYTGFELYFLEGRALLLVVPLLVALVPLFLYPWRGGPPESTVPGLGIRAWFAGLGALVALAGPSVALLFDEVQHRIGWYLHAGGWLVLYLAYFGQAAIGFGRKRAFDLRGGPRYLAVVALVAGPPVALLVNGVHNEMATVPEAFGLLALGWGMTLPLVLAGVDLERGVGHEARAPAIRAGWWFLVALTLAVHVVAALAD